MDLQMELVEIKNDEQLVQKFKGEENLLETWKSVISLFAQDTHISAKF